eukprot:10909976-Lingulodinium_polyedra.AAC.1
MEPERLLDADSEPGEVVNIGRSLRSLDDRVISNGPERHAGGVAHADAARQSAKRSKPTAETSRHASAAD